MKNIFLTISLGIGLLFPCKLHAQSQYPFQNTTLSTEEKSRRSYQTNDSEVKNRLTFRDTTIRLQPLRTIRNTGIQTATSAGRRTRGLFGLGFHQHFRWLPLGEKWQRKTGAMYAQEWRGRGFIFS